MFTLSKSEFQQLALRVQEAMQGDSAGLEIARLAKSFAEAVNEINSELQELAKLLGQGQSINTFVRLKRKPSVHEIFEILSIPGFKDWKACCETLSHQVPEELNADLANGLRDAFGDTDDLKAELVNHYKKCLQKEEYIASFPIIELLAQEYPSDKNFTLERTRIHEKLIRELEASLIGCMEKRDPKKESMKILASVRVHDIELRKDQGRLIEDALNEEGKIRIGELKELIAKLNESVGNLDADKDWKTAEKDYLHCLYLVESRDLDDHVDSKTKKLLIQYETKLTDIRDAHDIEVQIQDALAQIRSNAKLQNKSNPTYTRLLELVAKSQKFGFPIDPAIEKEIAAIGKAPKKTASKTAASSKGRKEDNAETKSKAPLFIGIGAAAVIGIGAFVGISMSSSDSPTNEQEIAQSSLTNDSEPKVASTSKQPLVAPGPNDAKTLSAPLRKETQVAAKTPQPEKGAAKSTTSKAQSATSSAKSSEMPSETRYREMVDELKQLVSKDYDPDSESLYRTLVSEIRALPLSRAPSAPVRAAQAQFPNILKAYSAKRDATAAQVTEEYRKDVNELKKLVSKVKRASRRNSVDEDFNDIRKQIEITKASYASIRKIAPEYRDYSISTIESDLNELRKKHASIDAFKKLLVDTQDIAEYRKILKKLTSLGYFTRTEERQLAKLSITPFKVRDSLQKRLSPKDANPWKSFLTNSDFIRETTYPDPEEIKKLKSLIDDSGLSSVMVTEALYLQGSPQPQSSKRVLIADQVQESIEKSKHGTSVTYTIRAFDDEGYIKPRTQHFNLLMRPDGSQWGFRYTKAKLSKESKYYTESINPTLKKVTSGAPRNTIIALIYDLDRKEDISPTFRAFWKSELLEFMKLNPLKWGLSLSPTLQAQEKELSTIKPDRTIWRASKEQKIPDQRFIRHFELAINLPSVKREMQQFSELIKLAAQSEIMPVGYAESSKSLHYTPKIKASTPLYSISRSSGEFEPLNPSALPDSFTPIFAYRFQNRTTQPKLQSLASSGSIKLHQTSVADIIGPLIAQ